jgi:hypothetical protein
MDRILLVTGFCLSSLAGTVLAAGLEDNQASPLDAQVASAEQCVALAYEITLKHQDADRLFKDCVERRAILIGMQLRYGTGNIGEIDIIDKIEGYAQLTQSSNQRVQQEASRFVSAAGE